MELELICLHIRIAIVSTQLNGLNYCYLILIILFNINHLFVDSEVVTSFAFQHYSFICTESIGCKYCHVIPIIQFRHTVKESFKYCYSTLIILFIITHSFAQIK